MSPSLRALLESVIDYAGIYPPARLRLDESVRNYLAYVSSPHAWLLGGFVCPAARLVELAQLLPPIATPTAFACCVVGTPPESLPDASQMLRGDLRRMHEFRQALSSKQGFTPRLSLEIRLPTGQLPTGEQIVEWAKIAEHSPNHQVDSVGWDEGRESHLVSPSALFLETPLGDSLQGVAASVCQARERTGAPLGLKFRTGGLTAAAFPSSRDLAWGIAVCRDSNLPYKLTAGLHHPWQCFDPAMSVTRHGFVNVLAAAALAQSHAEMTVDEVAAVLGEPAPTAFGFSDVHLIWRGRTVAVDSIRAARATGLRSFGSCSVDEPLEGLLGVL